MTPPAFRPVEKCWVCGAAVFSPVNQERLDLTWFPDPPMQAYHRATFWLQRCSSCGFIQPDKLPALPDFFGRLYDQQWNEEWIENEFTRSFRDFIFDQVLTGLAQRVPPDRRSLLDIGCQAGRLMSRAQQAGWQAEGIELNPRTAAFAARRTSLPVHQLDAQQLATEGRTFGAVTFLDVLEHIPDPVPLLAKIHALLAPGGWLVIKVPCGPNQLLKERIRAWMRRGRLAEIATNLCHVNHFTPRSLRLALERAGFKKIQLTLGAPELPEPPLTVRAAAALSLRLAVYHLGRILPGGVHTPLALNLQAFACKEG